MARRRSRAQSVETQRPSDHLSGHILEATFVTERIGPQPDQSLADADIELGARGRPPNLDAYARDD